MTTFLTSYLGGKGLDLLGKTIREKVIERWTVHRARCFLDSLMEAVEQRETGAITESRLRQILDDLFRDDVATELVFDAYRRVAMAASKTLGPKIIGLLTGRILLSHRVASAREEAVFLAAERMTDFELGEMADFLAKYRKKLESGRASKEEVELRWYSDSDRVDMDTSPFNFYGWLGPWAEKLHQAGLLHERVIENIVGDSSGGAVETLRDRTGYLILNRAVLDLDELLGLITPSKGKTE